LLDAVRFGPEDDVAEVTAVQVRRVVEDLIRSGQWRVGDPDILVVFDTGYEAPRMSWLLDGLQVEVLARLRSDRVMRKPVPRPWISPPQDGRRRPPGSKNRRPAWAKPSDVPRRSRNATRSDHKGQAEPDRLVLPGGVRGAKDALALGREQRCGPEEFVVSQVQTHRSIIPHRRSVQSHALPRRAQ
jgi:hypothetical protein